MTKPKPAAELTTEGALRRLFPKEVRALMRQTVRGQNAKEEPVPQMVTIEWDPDDKSAVKDAYELYARLKREGYGFADEARRRLSRFDKRLGKIYGVRAPAGVEQ